MPKHLQRDAALALFAIALGTLALVSGGSSTAYAECPRSDQDMRSCVEELSDRLDFAAKLFENLCDAMLHARLESRMLHFEIARLRSELGLPATNQHLDREPLCTTLAAFKVYRRLPQ